MLVGGQGVGKTKGLRKLLPPALRRYFKEGLTLNLRDKDSVTAAVSCWIAELGELEGTFKKIGHRRPQGFPQQGPRRDPGAVSRRKRRSSRGGPPITGTVNDVSFLADETGNRRFWPLTVGTVDVGWSDDEIEQLWAEAWSRYAAGEKWWPSADEERLLAENAERYRYRSGLEEAIESAFRNGAVDPTGRRGGGRRPRSTRW